MSCKADSFQGRALHKSISMKIWQVNALLITEAVLTGVILGIGACGQRYPRRSFTRFIFLGTTTLFLPITSYVVSTISINDLTIYADYKDYAGLGMIAQCISKVPHVFVVATSAYLVQITVINTSVVTAVDEREGQNIGPPWELLVQGVWTLYLGSGTSDLFFLLKALVLITAKMFLKYYASLKAQQSVALGQNPRLIFGYMLLQLQEASQQVESHVDDGERASPPPLLVMGEEGRHVAKQPCGYAFKDDLGARMINSTSLVTIDRVWHLDITFPMETPQLNRNLCLSFALFKLLRCRFARYEHTSTALDFFWNLLEDAGHDTIFGVIADELSFTNDYYYSSLPIFYSKFWLPILSIFTSLFTIVYCTLIGGIIIDNDPIDRPPLSERQIKCSISCIGYMLKSPERNMYIDQFGRWYFDIVPLFLLLLVVTIAEVRSIDSHICSNWTKVMLICRYANNASCHHFLLIKKWVGLYLQWRSNRTKYWDEKIGQCSILESQKTTAPLVLLRRLFRLQDKGVSRYKHL